MALTPECLERLQLSEQPFAPGARDKFLYRDTLLDAQIERMLRTLEKPGAILLLSASSGAGRSTQLMRLLAAMPRYFEIVAFRGRSNTTFASVDVTIRKHLAAHGDDDRGRALNDLLIERGKRGIDMLIAVDDAHLLGSGILRQLLKLGEDVSAASPIGPRLLLMGDAVLGRNYQRIFETEDDRQVQHIGLLAFNQEQASAYLRQRLAAAGNAEIASLFKPEIVANLHQRSRGLPGDLNALAEEWLSNYCETLAHKSQATPPPAGPPEAPPDDDLPDDDLEEPAEEDAQQTEPPQAPAETSESLELDDTPATEEPAPVEEDSAKLEDAPSSEPLASAAEPAAQPQTPDTEEKRPKRALAFWKQPWFLPTATGAGLVAIILSIGLNLPEDEYALNRPAGDATRSPPPPSPATSRPATATEPRPPAPMRVAQEGPMPQAASNGAQSAHASNPIQAPTAETPDAPPVDHLGQPASTQTAAQTAAQTSAQPKGADAQAQPTPSLATASETHAGSAADTEDGTGPAAEGPDSTETKSPDAAAETIDAPPTDAPIEPRAQPETAPSTASAKDQQGAATTPAQSPPAGTQPASQTPSRATTEKRPREAPTTGDAPVAQVRGSASAQTYHKARTRSDLLWLSEQNPDHLTIQLIALNKVSAVEAYLESHQLEGANIIPTGPVVIAVFGSYPDMDSAMTGLSSLPLEVLAQGYWIRSIGDVQMDARR